MFTAVFLRALLERGIKTAAQSVLTLWLVGDQLANAFEFDWSLAGGVALGGFCVSALTSIVSEPFGPTGSPSLVTDADNTVRPDAA